MEAITVEQLEALAERAEADQEAECARLRRLIRAHARILAAREPDAFGRRATEYADEDGHWDSSFPPKQRYKAYTGPRLIKVREPKTDDVATSSGFYYSWRRVTENPGLYVAPDGAIWGAEHSGTGSVGQYAAHPGDHGVEIEIEYAPICSEELTPDDLREAEAHLRRLAFPLSQAA